MQTFTIKRGDTSPGIRYHLGDSSIILAGASVVFNMVDVLRQVKVIDRASATIESGEEPIVNYAWALGDTDEPGQFFAEFELTYSDGSVETFPKTDSLLVQITRDLA